MRSMRLRLGFRVKVKNELAASIKIGDLVKHKTFNDFGFGVVIERSRWFGDPDYFWVRFTEREDWCHSTTLERQV